MFQAFKNSDLFYLLRWRKEEEAENSSSPESREGPPGGDPGV